MRKRSLFKQMTDITASDIFISNMGLEKESLRITKDGFIARTPHPFENDSFIKMDFAEPQTEIATPVCRTADELYSSLYSLHKKTVDTIAKNGELLWCLSCPPLFKSENDIPIAEFKSDPEETEFRIELAKKYGRKVMLYSGIHFNFSYSDELIKKLYRSTQHGEDFREFKDKLYLRVAKNCFKYIWFLVYLTAASPVCDSSFINGDNRFGGKFCSYASMRNSPHGYKNKQLVPLDLSSVNNYVNTIRKHVQKGRLMHISELYSPVRIKAKRGHSTTALKRDGIEFLELRVFDLNPFSPCGFAKCDIEFLQLFMIYMLSLPDFDFNLKQQTVAETNRIAAAKFDPDRAFLTVGSEKMSLRTASVKLANDMTAFFEKRADNRACEILSQTFERVYHPEKRYAVRLTQDCTSFIEHGLHLTERQNDMLL